MVEESYWKRFKRFLRDYTLEVSILGLILSMICTVIGLIGVLIIFGTQLPDYNVQAISTFLDRIGNWAFWVFIIAVIILFIAAWFLYTNIADRKKFKELIDTGSKSVFVKNQNELEEIAFRLGTKFQDILFEKKRELKVK